MSGILMALTGKNPSGPPPADDLDATWYTQGSEINYTGASGSTNTSQYFTGSIDGGSGNYGPSVTITDNPSGKLNISNIGAFRWAITWSGMAVGEVQYISTRLNVTDNETGEKITAGPSTAVVKRVS